MRVRMNPLPHIVFFVIERYGEAILIERGFYFGFPGDRIHDGEDLSLCARRVVSTLGRSIDESSLSQVVGGVCDWDRQPAVFDIYAQKDIDTRRLAKVLGRPRLSEHRSFDRFVDIFVKAPHKVVHPRHRSQKMLSAA